MAGWWSTGGNEPEGRLEECGDGVAGRAGRSGEVLLQ